ncbi:MAG TPA: hypothetical protein PK072_07320, partial [Quisquiliibacterium sp.]|nr:hypothetical protein [Quisquiliibacterium sp.]
MDIAAGPRRSEGLDHTWRIIAQRSARATVGVVPPARDPAPGIRSTHARGVALSPIHARAPPMPRHATTPLVVFSHANSFPAGTYSVLFRS